MSITGVISNKIIVFLLIMFFSFGNCNGQKKEYPMDYQSVTLSKKEQMSCQKLIKKESVAHNKIEVSKYARRLAQFLFVSYNIEPDYSVLDYNPADMRGTAIIDVDKERILPKSKETLSLIAKEVNMLNNKELTDDAIFSIISNVIYNGQLLTAEFTEELELFNETDTPAVERGEDKIVCTAYLLVSDSGMTIPRAEKRTITINKDFSVILEKL